MMDDVDEIDQIERQKKKREKIIKCSKVFYGGVLYEQIYNPDTKKTQFLGLQNEQPLYMDYFQFGDEKWVPINDDILSKGAVILPSGIDEFGDVKTLEESINKHIYTYLDISDEHRQKATWYVRLSWTTDLINTIPYLRALGDYGTGKTRYLDTIGGICYKPMFVGGAVHAAPIYRVVDLWKGTAIFDEFTLSKSDETEDIVQILNNGYQRNKCVLRCKEGNNEVVCFDPFGPKVLSTRKTFSDKALESRCITEIVKETSRDDIPIDLTDNFLKERSKLQNQLLLYRLRFWDKIKQDECVHVDFGNVLPRIKQTFLPFVVLFQHDQVTLNKFILTVREYNDKLVEENSDSTDSSIVKSYLELMKMCEGNVIITSSEIRNHMVNFHHFDEKLNARTVGRRLKPMGFKVESETLSDGKTYRIVSINEGLLKRLIYRYIPSVELESALKASTIKPNYRESVKIKMERMEKIQTVINQQEDDPVD